MGWLNRLFERRPAPEKSLDDAVLGPMSWSDDADGWVGTCCGTAFSVSHAGGDAVVPPDHILEYAREILPNRQWLLEKLQSAKADAARRYGPFYQQEIAELTYDCIDVYDRKGAPAMIASLDGGRDYR